MRSFCGNVPCLTTVLGYAIMQVLVWQLFFSGKPYGSTCCSKRGHRFVMEIQDYSNPKPLERISSHSITSALPSDFPRGSVSERPGKSECVRATPGYFRAPVFSVRKAHMQCSAMRVPGSTAVQAPNLVPDLTLTSHRCRFPFMLGLTCGNY